MEKRHKVNRRDRARNRFSVRLPCKVWGYDEQRKASFQCWARLKHVSIQYPNHWLASSLVNPRTSSCGSNRVTWTQAEFITCVDDFPELSNLNDELKLVLRSLQWLQSLRSKSSPYSQGGDEDYSQEELILMHQAETHQRERQQAMYLQQQTE